MPHNLTGIYRIFVHEETKDSQQLNRLLVDTLHLHGFDEAILYFDPRCIKAEDPYHNFKIDGRVAASVHGGTGIHHLMELEEVKEVMWVDASDGYGNFTFQFSDNVTDERKRDHARRFLDGIRCNLVISMENLEKDFFIEIEEGAPVHVPYALQHAARLKELIDRDRVREGLKPTENIAFGKGEHNPYYKSDEGPQSTRDYPFRVGIRYNEDKSGYGKATVYYPLDLDSPDTVIFTI